MPKISVILPVYNGEKYLQDSIESVLGQTFQDFELIIVDDCSTDESPVIAKKYAESNSKIVYVRNEINLKLPASLNKGFELASGPYWTWTSCDNIFLPNAFSILVSKLDSAPEVGLVYSSMHIIDDHSKIISNLEAGPSKDIILRNVVGACFMYKASLAKQVGQYNQDMFLCEDYEYWLRIARVSKIKPITDNLYLYRRHYQSLSHIREREIIKKGIALQKDFYCHFIRTTDMSARFYAQLRSRDIYNPFRQFYLFFVLFYSPKIFIIELYNLVKRRFKKHEKN